MHARCLGFISWLYVVEDNMHVTQRLSVSTQQFQPVSTGHAVKCGCIDMDV